MGCKKIFQLLSLFSILLIAVAAYIGIYKPDFVLDPAKELLNNPYSFELEIHSDERIDIEKLITENKTGELIITEDQVYNLINDKFPKLQISRIEVEEGKLLIFRNIAEKGKPLWLVFEVELIDGKYKLSRMGFGKIEIPKAFKDQTVNWAIERFLSSGWNDTSKNEFTKFLGGDIALLLNPEYVVMEKDQIRVKLVNIEPGKFQNLLDSIDPQKYTQDVDKTVDEVMKVLNSNN
jgi:hypothetical protein